MIVISLHYARLPDVSTDLSVIIPTRERVASLIRVLRSIAADDGCGDIEVVVVDDGVGDAVRTAVGRVDWPFLVRVVSSGSRGLNAAREAGLAAVSNDNIAFLDDDVTVHAGWIAGARSAFDPARDLAGAGGRTVAAEPDAIPGWVSPEKRMYLSVLDLGGEAGPFPRHSTPVGANLLLRREWIDRVGGFRRGLDREGDSLLSGGDTDVYQRIVRAGGRFVYWPAATVSHHLDPQRLTRGWFRRRALAQGKTDVLRLYVEGPRARDYVFEFVRPVRALAIAAKRVAQRRPLFDAELWLWSSRGRLAAVRSLRRRTP